MTHTVRRHTWWRHNIIRINLGYKPWYQAVPYQAVTKLITCWVEMNRFDWLFRPFQNFLARRSFWDLTFRLCFEFNFFISGPFLALATTLTLKLRFLNILNFMKLYSFRTFSHGIKRFCSFLVWYFDTWVLPKLGTGSSIDQIRAWRTERPICKRDWSDEFIFNDFVFEFLIL